jgi:nicotinate phosphoribosyltransferase
MQAQFIETMVLLTINHQSLIATKSSRIVRAARGRAVMEFGSRRAQGADGAVLGARAAYIAGAAGTACVLSDRMYGVPAVGTMAHSWVQMFDSEFEAFKAYATVYPDSCVLLVDTYNVLRSGIPNAIKVAKEVLEPMGKRLKGVRIDSGDIAYLSKRTREMLDEAGMQDCKITASNSLDEHLIRDLISQGACIDSFGIGERLITSKSEPVFGGVYKLAALEDEQGNIIPKIKISENVEKITTPHFKKVYRLYDNKGMAIADQICLHDEVIDDGAPLEIFDPESTWKRKTISDFTATELMVPIFIGGELVYDIPGLEDVRTYCREQLDTLWPEVKRFSNPHHYYVDLSRKLWDVKNSLLNKH